MRPAPYSYLHEEKIHPLDHRWTLEYIQYTLLQAKQCDSWTNGHEISWKKDHTQEKQSSNLGHTINIKSWKTLNQNPQISYSQKYIILSQLKPGWHLCRDLDFNISFKDKSKRSTKTTKRREHLSTHPDQQGRGLMCAALTSKPSAQRSARDLKRWSRDSTGSERERDCRCCRGEGALYNVVQEAPRTTAAARFLFPQRPTRSLEAAQEKAPVQTLVLYVFLVGY